ncbi:MAG: hypothetical protein GX339_06195 [Tissierellia bacterium]|nr:hypothetical protein [Tissierellia bacterium]
MKRKIKKNKGRGYKFFISFITGLLWGTIIGSLSISILVSYRLDKFYEKIAYLENTIVDKEEKLEKLEKSINNANIVLKDVLVILEYINLSSEQIDQMDSIEIEKTIKEKYSSSLGKGVKELDPDILVQVVDKRILRFNNVDYQLTVNKLVLSDVLKLWIEVSSLEVAS